MTTIVQVASGEQAALLASVAPLHKRYARIWGFRYVQFSNPKPNPQPNKLQLIQEVLEDSSVPEGSLVVWLDPDALIVWPWRSLEDALPPGMDLGFHRQNNWQLELGVLFLRKSAKVLEYVRQVAEGKDGGWFLPKNLGIWSLNRAYDEFQFSKGRIDGPVIIRAWHGERFICKMRGFQKYIPRTSFMLELREHNISEAEAFNVAVRG